MINKLKEDSVWNDALIEMFKRGICSPLSFPDVRGEVINKLINGTYEFQPPRQVEIPKDDGGVRKILVLNDTDRVVMSVLYKLYYEEYSSQIHHSCRSYQNGVSVAKTAREVQRHFSSGVKLDLSKYFDSVPIEWINHTLGSMFPNSGPTQVLLRFYNDNRIIVKGEVTPHYKSLCQGCAFGALLANLILVDVDEYMTSNADYYVRYSDDMLIFDTHVEQLVEKLTELLALKGLTLNPKKVKYLNDSFDFLGVRISRDTLGIGTKGWKNLKTEVKRHVKRPKRTTSPANFIKSSIKNLYRYFSTSEVHQYSPLTYWASICTTDEDFKRLDLYCKDTIRAAYTGRHNVTHNLHVMPNSMFKECGWCDLSFLWRLSRIDTGALKAYIKYVGACHKPTKAKDRTSMELSEFADRCNALWKCAKYGTKTYLNTRPLPDTHILIDPYDINDALHALTTLIRTSKVDLGGRLFIKLEDDLYVFQDWVD